MDSYIASPEKKLKTKNYTEYKVVGVSDQLLYNIWICIFMKSRGYSIKQNIPFQDNQSEIKIDKNGKKLCNGKSRHVNI